MLYIHDTRDISCPGPSVVTIGKFDGFHRGHRKLLKAARELAGDSLSLVVFTFSRSPQMFLVGSQGEDLNDHEEKLRLAEELGVDVLVEYPFSDEVRHMEAEDFLSEILCSRLKAAHIVAGPDCCFGYQRRGNARFLLERRQQYGYELHIVEKEEYRGEAISSTRIRRALELGQMQDVNAMLGYSFGCRGEILEGNHIGRTLGFPTVNQRFPRGKLAPAFGVYASRVILDGESYPAISNVGVKPTVGGEYPRGVESFLYDYSGDLYGKVLDTVLLEHIRPERRFGSLEELKRQVEEDRKTVWDRFLQGAYPEDTGDAQVRR